jgi:hypothetical protein
MPTHHTVSSELFDRIFIAENKRDLIVSAISYPNSNDVSVQFGDMNVVFVSKEWFVPSGVGTTPDFNDIEIIDDGLTLRLGQYEVASDAIPRY